MVHCQADEYQSYLPMANAVNARMVFISWWKLRAGLFEDVPSAAAHSRPTVIAAVSQDAVSKKDAV